MTPARARLWNPSNAVRDTGITMRNGWPVQASVLPFRPTEIAAPISEVEWPKHLNAEFWLPWTQQLPSAPTINRTIAQIIWQVAEVFGVSKAAVLSKSRMKRIVSVRQTAMAVACRLSDKSTLHIGRAFQRDHSTVIHAKRKMARHIEAVAAELGDTAPPVEWARAMKRRLESP